MMDRPHPLFSSQVESYLSPYQQKVTFSLQVVESYYTRIASVESYYTIIPSFLLTSSSSYFSPYKQQVTFLLTSSRKLLFSLLVESYYSPYWYKVTESFNTMCSTRFHRMFAQMINPTSRKLLFSLLVVESCYTRISSVHLESRVRPI